MIVISTASISSVDEVQPKPDYAVRSDDEACYQLALLDSPKVPDCDIDSDEEFFRNAAEFLQDDLPKVPKVMGVNRFYYDCIYSNLYVSHACNFPTEQFCDTHVKYMCTNLCVTYMCTNLCVSTLSLSQWFVHAMYLFQG